MRIVLLLARLALATIFLVAGYAKVKPLYGLPWSVGSVKVSLSSFAMQVDGYQMLPERGVELVSHFLPFFEMFLGLWILSGIGLRVSSIVSILMFCVFMGAIAWAYHKGLNIKCGCGIGPDEEVGPGALIRDGLKFLPIALLVAFGSFWSRRKRAPTVIPVSEAASTTQV
jgi:uncharacterized membrane protein YphA (DoxX/SURF4 family)